MKKIKLTQYSHGAGCGCKIAPQVLEEILKTDLHFPTTKNLLVGNSTKDDAAVYDLENGMALISTTDFFTPIVNDAFDFGRVAASNAISDVYAMGGKPIMALAILGFPVDKLPVEIAQQILAGARTVCAAANIPLAGGHSIDSPEPIFGLSVNGLVEIKNLKRNDTAKENDWLLLTKPLGIGILATAEKRELLDEEENGVAVNCMTQLNSIGEILGKVEGVTALTDVTGFGLAGHLIELCDGANLSAELFWNKIPQLKNLKKYLDQGIRPDATTRNWSSYGSQISFADSVPVMDAFNLLPDPQTSGGLLIAVDEKSLAEVQLLLKENNLAAFIEPIGRMTKRKEKTILVSV